MSAEVKDNSINKDKLDEDVLSELNRIDSAVQEVAEGIKNGTISVDGTDVLIHGLQSAAYADISSFDAAGAAAAVVGNILDSSSANTIYGVKALIEESLR